jgi:hypothetical protein
MIEPFIDLLNDLICHGTVVRKIALKYLMNPDFYREKIDEENKLKLKEKSFLNKVFLEKSSSIKNFRYPNKILKRFESVKYETIFDELLFWSVEHLLPQPLCRLFENLLPDVISDEARCSKFVKTFTYEYLHTPFVSSITEEQLHQQIGCQLFNNPNIAKKAVENYNAFQIMITAFFNYFHELKAIKRNNLQKRVKKKQCYFLNFQSPVLRKGLYFTDIVDMSYLLNHEDNSKFFLEKEIFSSWIQLVSYYQCVNNYKRQFGVHVEYDNQIAYSAFISEWEFCSVICWSLIQNLKDEKNLELTLNALEMIKKYLYSWFQAITKNEIIKIDRNMLSFHIPLTRHYSILLYNSIYKQNAELDQVFNHNQSNLLNLLAHPLQINISFHEIHANLWSRNGLQMKECVIYYTRNDFCRSFIDADLFMMQLVAAKLDKDLFIQNILDKFYIFEYCLMKNKNKNSIFYTYDELQQSSLISSALLLLVELVTIRVNLQLQNYDLVRQEVISLVCISSFTHSELKKYIPSTYNWGSSFGRVDVDKIIKDVAECHEPSFNDATSGELKQLKYTAKNHVWEYDFDPVFANFRSIQASEFQESMNRFTAYVKKEKLFDKPEALWPPFRLPDYIFDDKILKNIFRILHVKTLHSILFVLIYKTLNSNNFSDKQFYFVIYILDLMIHTINSINFDIENNENEEVRFSLYSSKMKKL